MLTFGRISKPGSRPVNEDAIGAVRHQDKYIFILCDGLGGHGSGDIASSSAKEAFEAAFRDYDGDAGKFFADAFKRAGSVINEMQKSNDSMALMKTTLVSLLIDGDVCTWAHIGDSRLYYFSNGSLVCRTADHSVPQMLYKSGEIEESEIRFHPDRNKLLRALGEEGGNPQYTVSVPAKLEGSSAFLLCSDGFWEYITEDAMEMLLRESKDADDWMSRMTEIVEKNNSGKRSDNYSAISVMIKEDN